jgi:hypothetical protein
MVVLNIPQVPLPLILFVVTLMNLVVQKRASAHAQCGSMMLHDCDLEALHSSLTLKADGASVPPPSSWPLATGTTMSINDDQGDEGRWVQRDGPRRSGMGGREHESVPLLDKSRISDHDADGMRESTTSTKTVATESNTTPARSARKIGSSHAGKGIRRRTSAHTAVCTDPNCVAYDGPSREVRVGGHAAVSHSLARSPCSNSSRVTRATPFQPVHVSWAHQK